MRNEPLCPECLGETGWDFYDAFVVGKHVFHERGQVCPDCGWVGVTVLFPRTGNPSMDLHMPPLPADPFDDAVPMHPSDGAVPMLPLDAKP